MKYNFWVRGCGCHWSILRPQVRIPSTPSMLSLLGQRPWLPQVHPETPGSNTKPPMYVFHDLFDFLSILLFANFFHDTLGLFYYRQVLCQVQKAINKYFQGNHFLKKMEHLKSQYLLSKNGHCCHDTKLSSPKIFNPKILLIYRTKDFDIKSFPKSKLTLISIFQIFLFVVTKKSRFIDAYQNKCCANNDVTLLLLRCLFLLALDNDVSHGSVTNF